MAEPRTGNIVTQDSESEHIGPDYTGDNISAKKTAGYVWDGNNWVRSPAPLLTAPYDSIVINYTDSTKATISTIVSYLGGSPQETITFTSGSTSDTYTRS